MADTIIIGDKAIAEALGLELRTYYKKLPTLKAGGCILRRYVRKKCSDGKYRRFRMNYSTEKLLLAFQVKNGGI